MYNQTIAPYADKDRLLTLILNENQCARCVRLAKKIGIGRGIVMIGRGTVKSSVVLNLLGIKSQKREVVSFYIRKERVNEILDYFSRELNMEKPGHGIAFTTPILLALGNLEPPIEGNTKIDGIVVKHREEILMFKKLTVIVDRGKADEVMDIARKAGVRGGTILHGRGAGAEIATKLFGVEIEPEKELVTILTPEKLVDKVVEAITKGLNLEKPGKGVLFVEPVLETRGLFESNNKESKGVE